MTAYDWSEFHLCRVSVSGVGEWAHGTPFGVHSGFLMCQVTSCSVPSPATDNVNQTLLWDSSGSPSFAESLDICVGCVPSRCDLASVSGLYTSSSSSQVLALWGHLLIPETSLKPVVCMLTPPGLPACWGHPLMRLCHPPFSSVSYTTSLTLPPPTLLQQLLATGLLRAHGCLSVARSQQQE